MNKVSVAKISELKDRKPAHALVGEGKEIPDNSMVLGMPGKIVRTLDEQNEKIMIASAEHYVENWRRYQANLKKIG